jgi:hypothetical protein
MLQSTVSRPGFLGVRHPLEPNIRFVLPLDSFEFADVGALYDERMVGL